MTSDRAERFAEDEKLHPGLKVEVNWVANRKNYQAQGKVEKLRSRSVTVKLTGRQIVEVTRVDVPRYCDVSRWSPDNCVRLVRNNPFRHKDCL